MSVRPARNRATGEPIPGAWDIDYYPQGRKSKRVIRQFGSAEDPRTEAEARALEMELRRLGRREPVSKINPTVYSLLADWKQEYKNHHEPSTCKDLDACLVHLIPFFGKLFLAEVSPRIVEQYKAQRLAAKIVPKKRKGEADEEYEKRKQEQTRTISKRTINKELSYLSSFCRWAADNGYGEPVKIKLFPAKQTKADRARPLHPDQVAAMLEHLEPQYRLTFLLYNDAGLRRAEVLGGGKYVGIRAEDIDMRFGVIYVRGKGDKERIVPIATDRLRAELAATLETVKTGHLCINPKTKKPWYSIRKALIRAAEAAGIDRRVYHHLLRHNFGTHAVAAGMNLRTVQEILGHSTIKTTEIYTHMGEFLHSEAAKLQKFLDKDAATPKDATKAAADPPQTRQGSGTEKPSR